MTEIIGYVGAIAFSLCAFPQAYVCYRQGHGRGLSRSMLWLWLVGEICMIYYVLASVGWDGPLMINYLANLLGLFVIMRYTYYERK